MKKLIIKNGLSQMVLNVKTIDMYEDEKCYWVVAKIPLDYPGIKGSFVKVSRKDKRRA
jgi:hypothetical protein